MTEKIKEKLQMRDAKVKLQTVKIWQKRDYARTVALSLCGCIAILGIFVLSIFLNTVGEKPSDVGFVAYFKKPGMNFLFIALTVILLGMAMFMYFYFDKRDFYKNTKNISMVYTIIIVAILFNIIFGRFVHINARPLVLATLLTMTLIDKKSAMFVNFVVCLLMFLLDKFTNAVFYSGNVQILNGQVSSLIMGFTTGVAGIYFVSAATSRFKVILYSLTLIVPEIICVMLLSEGATFTTDWRLLTYGIISGFIAVVLFLALLPIFEVVFNKTTDYRLAELTNHDSKLIKKLRDTAPGTFNHSVVVANLAEACASAIGENPMLARACAYYHDIGKLKEPRFFAENQMGQENLHNDLTPELSTNIIRSHAKDGYELAKKCHLPDEIANACLEHHGTMPIKFFYAKALKFTDGDVDIKKFSYTGPKPQSKITAILMIADSAEAAVRALSQRDRDSVDHVIQSIIDERMELGQFDECPITIRDLFIIKNTIDNCLTGVYHSRIKYPKVKLHIDMSQPEE